MAIIDLSSINHLAKDVPAWRHGIFLNHLSHKLHWWPAEQ